MACPLRIWFYLKCSSPGFRPFQGWSSAPRRGQVFWDAFVDLLSYRFASPQRGDLAVFSTAEITGLRRFTQSTQGGFFIQRIVGLPGETIQLKEGKVFADGKPLGEADGIPPFEYQKPGVSRPAPVMSSGEWVVGKDEYLVLGDNTSNSLDSRYWGCVPKSSIHGKVSMIYYPFTRAGRLPAD